MIRLLTAFLTVASAACASHGRIDSAPMPDDAGQAAPYAFFPPVGFEEADADALACDMSIWNAVTNSDHRLGWSDLGHLRIVPFTPPIPAYAGQWTYVGVMFIAPGQPVAGVGLHEFGHAIGLGHLADPDAVMCSADLGVSCVYPPPSSLTQADIDECRRAGACP